MDNGNVQLRFFQYIKTKVPANASFVDEIADLLNISNDSAYRRIRADKPISFEELQKLCVQYKVSLDQFLNLQSDAFIFTGKLDNSENF
ncbi:MAG: helix-turn-helix domain-containing protein, partial [Ferruginibacter sp.]